MVSSRIVLTLICLIGLGNGVPSSGLSPELHAPEDVDPRAFVLLQQLDATYKSMRSFSTEFDEGTMSQYGHVSFSRHAQFAFRRWDYLAFATEATNERTLGRSKVMTDGKNAYLMLAEKPITYTELLDRSPLGAIGRLPHKLGALYLYRLLEGDGIAPNSQSPKLMSLSSKRGKFVDGNPVETVTAKWTNPKEAFRDQEIYTYTIGSRDHLLYQVSIEVKGDPIIRVARYLPSQPDASLPDSVFMLPQGVTPLPSMHVVAVNEPQITLDKGSLDGVVVGDTIDVYTDGKSNVWTAQLLVTKTDAHTCEADLIKSVARLNNICIIVGRKADPSQEKREPDNNFWLWTPKKQ